MSEGGYYDNGSWSAKRTPNPLGLDGFVNDMVRRRRANHLLPPWQFSKLIASSGYAQAFPNAVSTASENRKRWTAVVQVKGESVAIPWTHVATSTSAESAIVYATARRAPLPETDEPLRAPDFSLPTPSQESWDAERARQLEQARSLEP